tara:strand:- start:675 stop:1187 length:513 start_codon:yes stop_codon:yes gene_type:complete
MTTTESTLDSTNFLQPNGFKIVVLRKRFKNLEFFAQTVTHPDLSVGPVRVPFRGTDAYMPGDKLEYGTLSVEAIMDENMNIYKEMHSWLESTVTGPYKTSDRAKLDNQDVTTYDIRLMVLSSKNNTTNTIQYKSAFPINIGSVNFQSTSGDIQYISFPITFQYTGFTITA